MRENVGRNYKIASSKCENKFAGRRKLQAEAEEKKLRIEADVMERNLRVEAEERKFQAELQEREGDRQRQLELELKRVGVTDLNLDPEPESDILFRMASAIKLVPKFDEADIEHYIMSLEKAMQIHKFSREKLSALLHSQLTGEAQKGFLKCSFSNVKIMIP